MKTYEDTLVKYIIIFKNVQHEKKIPDKLLKGTENFCFSSTPELACELNTQGWHKNFAMWPQTLSPTVRIAGREIFFCLNQPGSDKKKY